jgi:hypothetical protein
MLVVPKESAVTVPEAGLIVATDGVKLLQVPPEILSARIVVAPTHNDVVPTIAGGTGATVTGIVAVQPVLSV